MRRADRGASAPLRVMLAVAGALAVAGCQSMGAASVEADRIDYASAMAESWKQQMLLNIVKFRYFDTPVFLDVSSVISAYELAGEVSLSAGFGHSEEDTGANNMVGTKGSFTDSPTITYTPLTGENFVNALLKPLPPQTIFAMIETGHPADFILRIAVSAMNGVRNRSAAPARTRSTDLAFQQVTDALRRIQRAGALSMRTEKETTWISFQHDTGGDVEKDISFVVHQLGIKSDNGEFLLSFGSRRHRPDEIAVLTRSMQEILVDLGAGVDIPESDLKEGRATTMPLSGQDAADYPLVHIRVGNERPRDAYTAAHYRGHWFWIDDRDLKSKRIFMFLMIFSSLAETGVVPQTPIVTIPAHPGP